MKTRSITTLVILVGTITPGAGSARTLDRRGAVRAALMQNPQIAAARAEEAAVEAQGRQVDAARWPLVTLTAGVAPSLAATLVPGTADQSVESQYKDFRFADMRAAFLGNITVIQPLYTFGKIAHRQEAAEHGLRAREAQTRMQRADVAFEVARIYEGNLLARDAERFFDEMIHWLESTLEATEEKLAGEVRNVKEGDVFRLQTAIGLARIGLHQAQAGRNQARAGLTAYLGLPKGEEIATVEDELVPVGSLPPDPEALMKLAGDHRPELTALDEGRRALQALSRAEAAGAFPDIFAAAFLSAAYTPGRDWIETRFVIDPLNNFIPGAFLGLRWQLQGHGAGARASEQAARAEALRQTGQWAGTGIPAEVRRAYEDVARAVKDIEDGNQGVSKAKRWMVQAAADYSVGFQDLREVSDAVTAYVTLRGAVMQARFEHNVAMAALARATGTLDGESRSLYLAEDGATSAAAGASVRTGVAPEKGSR